MTFRAKIIFYASLVLLFVIGLILALILRGKGEPSEIVNENKAVPNNKTNEKSVNLPSLNNVLEQPTKKITAEDVKKSGNEAAIKNLVKNFVERFGSYSVSANFANFVEIKPLVTDSVAKWLDQYANDLPKKQAAGFNGITTKVLSQKIISLSSAQATVLALTQREETINGSPSLSYRNMLVKLILQNGEWRVDGAYWQ